MPDAVTANSTGIYRNLPAEARIDRLGNSGPRHTWSHLRNWQGISGRSVRTEASADPPRCTSSTQHTHLHCRTLSSSCPWQHIRRTLARILKQCHLREDWRWMYISGPEKRCSSRSGRTCRRLRRATDLIPLTGIAAVFVGHSDTGRLPVLCRSILANRSSSRVLGANLLPSKGSLPLPLFLQLVPRRVLQAPLQRTFDPFLQVTCSERSTICLPKRIRPSSLDWSLSRWQGGSI